MDQDGKVYEIRGTVRGRNNAPLHDARVVVWWQRIRERIELADAETSEHGRYHLSYRVSENAPQPLLLVVEARSEYLDAPLVSPLTKAEPDLQIDLILEPLDQSEWATLVRSIEPLLDGLKLSEFVEDRTHQDISFLAREVGKSTEVVMRVAVSARLDAAFKIPGPAFYAFLRQQVPVALPSPLFDASQNFAPIDVLGHHIGSLIFSLSAQVQTQTLTSAVALGLIGPQFTKQIPQLVSELQVSIILRDSSPIYLLKLPPPGVRVSYWGSARRNAPSPLRVPATIFKPAGWPLSFGLSRRSRPSQPGK